MFKTLDDFDFNGKTVFIRADLNVPTKDGQISDTTRIDRFAPTLKYILDHCGKAVVASHFGRPKGQKNTLKFANFICIPRLDRLFPQDTNSPNHPHA